MIKIQREYKEECIVYNFVESIATNDLERIEEMLREDIRKTYAFVLDFTYIKKLNAQAVSLLKKLYLHSVESACDMIICGLNAQPAMMLEILQANKLYTIKPNADEAMKKFRGENDAVYNY